MKLNADLMQRVVVDTGTLDWVPSPEPGVARRMLERDGEEVARATSIVRYDPGARFAAHTHGGGEELFVLEGTFCDEHGVYPAGTYVRNPPGSAHAPFTAGGCTLLVKLRQMQPRGEQRLVVDTRDAAWNEAPAGRPARLPLFRHPAGGESVALVRFGPGDALADDLHTGGEEVLVLDGVLEDEHGSYPAGTWLRQPHGSRHAPFSRRGCTLWLKRGHLPR